MLLKINGGVKSDKHSAELGLANCSLEMNPPSSEPSPMGTPRIPSRHGRTSSSNSSPLRPSSARSLRTRPATPGSPTILNTDLKVDSRPITQQGMISMRSSFQGPGRQILDRSYFVGRLRSKKQELQQEIDRMVDEIEQLDRERMANAHVEQKQDTLQEEVKGLKLHLGDYNMIAEKVNAGVELDEMREELSTLKERNIKERKKVDRLFLERTLKERESKEIFEKAQVFEMEMERRIILEVPEVKVQYAELQLEYKRLESEVERLQQLNAEAASSNEELEQKISRSNPTKQKIVMLTEQLLSVESELEKLKTECPATQLTAEETKEALLSKIRQDNMEIINVEEKTKILEKDISFHEAKIVEADRAISELKGGRVEKFLEMQQKERKMQHFIENFETTRAEQEKRIAQTQERITELLQQISQGIVAAESYKASKSNHDKKFEDIENYKKELEFHRGELKQLDEIEAKTEADITSTKQAICLLENEIENFKRFDGSKSQSDARYSKLEAEKQKIEDKKAFLQEQVRDQVEKIETFNQILSESEIHKNLEEMKAKLKKYQSSNQMLQEEVEAKDRELNYSLVLENIRFMVCQLNTEIKNSQMQ